MWELIGKKEDCQINVTNTKEYEIIPTSVYITEDIDNKKDITIWQILYQIKLKLQMLLTKLLKDL